MRFRAVDYSLNSRFKGSMPISVGCHVSNMSSDPGVAYIYNVNNVLFISYKFVKGFLAIFFYYLLFLAEALMMCVNVFILSETKF